LILLNTRAGPDDAETRANRDKQVARVRRDGTGFLSDTMLPKLLAPSTSKVRPDVVAHVKQMMAGASADGVVQALEAMRDRPDSTPDLARITVPTLVIGGKDDVLIPAPIVKAMADAIPGAHCTIMPDAGHLTPLEQPINTSRLVSEFLEAVP
jgi:pimeloyl-ACP methyl ester carboxylesterase